MYMYIYWYHTLFPIHISQESQVLIFFFSNYEIFFLNLQWNMADYLFQNKATLQDNLEMLKSQTSKFSQTSLHAAFVKKIQASSLTVFDSLWMLLFK